MPVSTLTCGAWAAAAAPHTASATIATSTRIRLLFCTQRSLVFVSADPAGFKPLARAELLEPADNFTFYIGDMSPATYKNAAIIAQHGSWNRSTPSGYRVMVARTDGRRVTGYESLVDGFLGSDAGGRGAGAAAIGRPVDVLQLCGKVSLRPNVKATSS